jgi:hypothetical protein
MPGPGCTSSDSVKGRIPSVAIIPLQARSKIWIAATQ